MGNNLKEERLGAIGYNKQGDLMKIVEYNTNNNVIIEFQDGTRVKTSWERFNKGCTYNPNNSQKRCTNKYQERVGLMNTNKNGEVMKIVEYINATNVIVEFQDKYKTKVKTYWRLFKDGSTVNPNGQTLKDVRVGSIRENKDGDLMKVIKYNDCKDIIVEFQDEYRGTINTSWERFLQGCIQNPNKYIDRLGMEMVNTQGCVMKIIEYNSSSDIVVEFQNEYKWKTKTTWCHFINGQVDNAYYPTLHGVGIIGDKYPITINQKATKEYCTWSSMLDRCCCPDRYPAYKDVSCCKEWFLYDNFCEWLHNQENFDVWKDMPLSALDKDILIKGNKIYSPETCCLVPIYVNALFISRRNKNKDQIQQLAQEEYEKGTISKKCYEAMMKWEVEIGD